MRVVCARSARSPRLSCSGVDLPAFLGVYDGLAPLPDRYLEIQGEVAILNGTPGNPQGATWNKCFEDKIKGTPVSVGTKLDTDWTPAGAYDAASALVSSGKDYQGIFYDYADPLPQVVSAYEKAGETTPVGTGDEVNPNE